MTEAPPVLCVLLLACMPLPPLPRSEVAGLLSGCAGGSLAGRVDAMLMDLGVSSMQVNGGGG